MEKSASEPNDSGAHDCAHRGWVKVVRNPLSPWVMLVRKPLPGWVMVVRNDRAFQPQPLAEPDVNLSIHPAPIIEPRG